MAEPDSRPIKVRISEAELERVKTETAKIEAEKRKLDLESAELGRPWYKKLRSLQTFAAIIVSIPVIWFYVTEIALPLNKAENIALALRNEIVGDSLKNQIKALKKEKELEADRYKLRLEELQRSYVTADSALKDLIRAHRDLSGRYEITQKQRDEIARERQVLLSRLEKQRKDLDRLSVQQIVTDSTQTIKDRATSSAKTPEIIIDFFVPDAIMGEISHRLMEEIRDSQWEVSRFLFVQTRIKDIEVTTPFLDGIAEYGMFARSDTTDLRWYRIRRMARTVIFRTARGSEKILEFSSIDNTRVHYLRVSEKD